MAAAVKFFGNRILPSMLSAHFSSVCVLLNHNKLTSTPHFIYKEVFTQQKLESCPVSQKS
jgi:hypothetical protein